MKKYLTKKVYNPYDNVGNLVELAYPEQGKKARYTYDSEHNQRSAADSRNQTFTMEYDEIGGVIMALSHDFALIEKNSKESFIDTNMNSVSISDAIVLYLNDSFRWIDTFWNGKEEKKGLNYYGYTTIKSENINKLSQIVNAWIGLFETAPEEFFLTGNYLPDENKYEKNLFRKEDVLLQLKSLNAICEMAVIQNMSVLHNGI